MPGLCGYSWLPEVDLAIVNRSTAYGLPLDVALTFIAAESIGFDTYSSGDEVGNWLLGFNDDPSQAVNIVGGDGHKGLRYSNGYVAWEGYYHPGRYYWSHGLLQLQTGGGQGTGMSWTQLINPWTTLDVGIPPIANAFRACWSAGISQDTFIRCIMRNSGHPGNVPDGTPVFEQAFANIWPKWQCFFQALVNTPYVPAPVAPPSPTPPLPNPLPPPPSPGGSTGNDIDWPLILSIGVSAFFIAKAIGPTVFKKKIILGPNDRAIFKKLII